MANSGEHRHPHPGSKHSNLRKSFQLGIRPLLTACSREDVNTAFSTFTIAERESLYRMFIQVIKSLHENIEEEFETICQETQVGATLDKVEQLVEEQSLDILLGDKVNIKDIKEKASTVKKDEIHYLKGLIEKTEEQNNLLKARIASLKADQSLASADAVEKLKSWNAVLVKSL